jgi:hypothetical protein
LQFLERQLFQFLFLSLDLTLQLGLPFLPLYLLFVLLSLFLNEFLGTGGMRYGFQFVNDVFDRGFPLHGVLLLSLCLRKLLFRFFQLKLFSGLGRLQLLDCLLLLLLGLLLGDSLLLKDQLLLSLLAQLLLELLDLLVVDGLLLPLELGDVVLLIQLGFQLLGLLLDDIHVVKHLLLALLHLLHFGVLWHRRVLNWHVLSVCLSLDLLRDGGSLLKILFVGLALAIDDVVRC